MERDMSQSERKLPSLEECKLLCTKNGVITATIYKRSGSDVQINIDADNFCTNEYVQLALDILYSKLLDSFFELTDILTMYLRKTTEDMRLVAVVYAGRQYDRSEKYNTSYRFRELQCYSFNE
jgi:hypothetical protein